MSEITCPSGMKVEIRGLKGKELRILQDKAAQKSGTFLDRILDACVLQLLEPGPYQLEAGAKIPWDTILVGDRFFILIAVRAETFGPEYSFKTQCAECRHRFEWELNLTDLPTKTLSDEDAKAVASGEPLEASLPDGRLVKFRLAVGRDERESSKSKNAENALVTMMSLRIVALDGNTEKAKIRSYLEDCSLSDLTKLLKEFDRRDCGIETSIEVECDECRAIKDVPLPLDRFFLA